MIKVGDNVRTNKKYKEKMYEPLYFEEILDGIVLSIDESNVAQVEILKSSCEFNKKFDNHMDKWRKGNIHSIGISWLEKIN